MMKTSANCLVKKKLIETLSMMFIPNNGPLSIQ